MKFLFVEDELELLELYEILLDDIGIDYGLAKNGKDALEKLESDSYDFIFSDIRMPVMDGLELLQAIQRKKIIIKSFIFMTAHVDISKEEIVKKGADDILYKPLSHKILQEYIKDLQNKY